MFVIHGGPEAQLRPIWQPLIQYFVSHGLAVAAPNVRGSTATASATSTSTTSSGGSTRCATSPRCTTGCATPGARPGARGVYGGSYGGYMVLAGLAFQPELWAAGIELVGISSLVTFLENTADRRRKSASASTARSSATASSCSRPRR